MITISILDDFTFSALWNKLGEWFESILVLIINLLPNTPFTIPEPPQQVINAMGYINWVIPVMQILSITLAWVTVIFTYYAYILILRWSKAIE